ncbi:MAG: hypothetical protein PHT59_03105 [Candidatus Omnitrophica bacterium]|nr:hypothetical protein [Candidatus Omnitrophota bacterium]
MPARKIHVLLIPLNPPAHTIIRKIRGRNDVLEEFGALVFEDRPS